MRVLLVSDFFPPVRGGLESHVGDLAGSLAERGHDVHVATLTQPAEPAPGVAVHRIRMAERRVLRHDDPARPFHPPLPDPLARHDLKRTVAQVRPDVVHGHSWLAASLPRSSVPLVLTAHDYALICQLHTLERTDGVLCSGPGRRCLRCGSRRVGWVKSGLLAGSTVAGRRLLRPAAIITLSRHVRHMLMPYVTAPITVVPGFLSSQAAAGSQPTSRPPLPTGRYLMFAGDPGAHKGIDILLRMWRDWKPADLSLLLATTRPFAAPADPSVSVVTLPRGQMAAAWRAAEVAVVPSTWQEGFGMVAIEALAAGTPVVASRIGGLAEVVDDGVNGLLVPPGDPVALRAALERVVGSPDVRRRMSHAAGHAADRYSTARVVPQIESVYEAAIEAAVTRPSAATPSREPSAR